MAKKVIKLSIEEELIAEARKVGVNISAFLENRLREFLNIENKDQNSKCGGRDLNPRTPTGLDPQSSAFS